VHDFANLMLRKTRNLVDVQHSLGHKNPRMSLRCAHLLPDDLKEAFRAIDNTGTALILALTGRASSQASKLFFFEQLRFKSSNIS